MKILVRNLATSASEEKIKSLFTPYGAVQSCNLVLDKKTGRSKGFGFIEMPKAGEAKVAIQKLNGYKLAGSIIRVKKAEVKTEAPLDAEQLKMSTNVANSKVNMKKSEQIKNNENNALNLYGKIKDSDN